MSPAAAKPDTVAARAQGPFGPVRAWWVCGLILASSQLDRRDFQARLDFLQALYTARGSMTASFRRTARSRLRRNDAGEPVGAVRARIEDSGILDGAPDGAAVRPRATTRR